MPQIPTYKSRASFPVSSNPRASFSNPALKGMEQAGAALSQIGEKFNKEAMDLKRTSQLVDLYSDASTKLHDLRSGVLTSQDFFSDPEAASNRFAEQTKALQGEYLDKIKDPVVAKMFKKHFASEALSMMGHVSDLAVQQRRDIGEGSFRNAIIRMGNLADSAPTDQEAQRYIGQATAFYNLMEQQGLVRPDQKVDQLQKFTLTRIKNRANLDIITDPESAQEKIAKGEGIYSLLPEGQRATLVEKAIKHDMALSRESRMRDKYAEEERVKVTNTQAMDSLIKTYKLDNEHADFGAAYSDVMDPEKAKELGLTTMDQRNHVGNTIMAMGAKMAKDTANKQKEVDDGFIGQVLTGKILPGQFGSYVDPKTGQPPSNRAVEHALRIGNAEESARNHTDPSLYADIEKKILDHSITDRSDLTGYIGRGISVSSHNELGRLIDTVNDPTKSKWWGLALATYDKRAKLAGDDPDEAMQKRSTFIAGLSQAIEDDKLKGSDILKRATEMTGMVFSEKPATGQKEVRKPIPKPGQSRAQVAHPIAKTNFVGFHKDTGAPVYKQPDGTMAADPAQKPVAVGTNKQTGEVVYKLPNGQLVTSGKPKAPTLPESEKSPVVDEDIDEDESGEVVQE